LIILANNERDKAPMLHRLRIKLDELIVLVRLAKEARAFKSFKSYYSKKPKDKPKSEKK